MIALSPKGTQIVGTLEDVEAIAHVAADSFDENLDFEYEGVTDVKYDTQRTRRAEYGRKVFVDEAGEEFSGSELIPARKEVIEISPDTAEEVNGWLSGEAVWTDDVLATFTAEFENGFEADIKVVGGGPTAWIDPVLFDNDGNQLAVQSPGEEIEGEYAWDVDGIRYIVEVTVPPF